MQHNKQDSKPERIYIEVTNKCNLKCETCFRRGQLDKSLNSQMNVNLFNKIIREACKCNVKSIIMGGWGEPLTHQKIINLIRTTKENNLTLEINTNGTLLSNFIQNIIKYVDKLIISIDAASEKTYRKVRGNHFQKIIRNIERIGELKRKMKSHKPEIWFSYTLTKENISDAKKIIKLASKLNVRGILFSNLIPIEKSHQVKCIYLNKEDAEKGRKLKAELARLSLYHQVLVSMPFFNLKTERSCPFIERKALCITHNGEVTPCYNFLHNYKCYIYGREKKIKQISFGNIKNQSLDKIWNNPQYVKFRQIVKIFHFPSCTDCDYHYDCTYSETNEYDCWGNSPTCSDCLYSRKIIICP